MVVHLDVAEIACGVKETPNVKSVFANWQAVTCKRCLNTEVYKMIKWYHTECEPDHPRPRLAR